MGNWHSEHLPKLLQLNNHSPNTPTMNNNNTKTVKNARHALQLALQNGWTAKEAAANTGLSIKSIQNACNIHNVRLTYGGHGPRPPQGWEQANADFLAKFQAETN